MSKGFTLFSQQASNYIRWTLSASCLTLTVTLVVLGIRVTSWTIHRGDCCKGDVCSQEEIAAKVMLAFRSCTNWEVMRTYVSECASAHVGFHSNSLLSILCVRQVPASVAATLSASEGASNGSFKPHSNTRPIARSLAHAIALGFTDCRPLDRWFARLHSRSCMKYDHNLGARRQFEAYECILHDSSKLSVLAYSWSASPIR